MQPEPSPGCGSEFSNKAPSEGTGRGQAAVEFRPFRLPASFCAKDIRSFLSRSSARAKTLRKFER